MRLTARREFTAALGHAVEQQTALPEPDDESTPPDSAEEPGSDAAAAQPPAARMGSDPRRQSKAPLRAAEEGNLVSRNIASCNPLPPVASLPVTAAPVLPPSRLVRPAEPSRELQPPAAGQAVVLNDSPGFDPTSQAASILKISPVRSGESAGAANPVTALSPGVAGPAQAPAPQVPLPLALPGRPESSAPPVPHAAPARLDEAAPSVPPVSMPVQASSASGLASPVPRSIDIATQVLPKGDIPSRPTASLTVPASMNHPGPTTAPSPAAVPARSDDPPRPASAPTPIPTATAATPQDPRTASALPSSQTVDLPAGVWLSPLPPGENPPAAPAVAAPLQVPDTVSTSSVQPPEPAQRFPYTLVTPAAQLPLRPGTPVPPRSARQTAAAVPNENVQDMVAGAATPELASGERLSRIVASAGRPARVDASQAGTAAESAPNAVPPIAFAGRLVRATPADEAGPPASSAPPGAPSESAAGQKPVPQSSARKGPVTPAASQPDDTPDAPHMPQPVVSPRPVPASDAPIERSQPDAPASPSPLPRQPIAVEHPAEAAKPAPTAHEIRLQLNGGEQRVEVRMVERGGDVHVAVRTPDSSLAGTLREDLPALSARLEQTGFHAESWHTGPSASAERLATPEAQAAGQQNPQNRSGQEGGRQQQQENRQPQPRESQNPSRKQDRKDFAWLFQSLR